MKFILFVSSTDKIFVEKQSSQKLKYLKRKANHYDKKGFQWYIKDLKDNIIDQSQKEKEYLKI